MNGTPARTVIRHLRSLTERQSDTSDEHLLLGYLGRRDEEAFAALVRRHGAMVFSVCRRVLDDEHDAEDAFQATFLVLARRAAAVRSPGSLAAWLHGVACRISLKARAEAARRSAVPLCDSAVPAPADPSWRDVRTVLDQELDRLPENLREPLVLCYLEGLTRDEAAARLSCPLGTLKGRLERGRELLRQRLVRRGV
ncbi:MAG TPA: sigma-70 family RNA polymerase sigma factor, partial [Gemmataceae bacterium]|nr:sigma-70 family RNA polymerase sigma factor [Gemmataceae bacterium]